SLPQRSHLIAPLFYLLHLSCLFFFLTATPPPEIYTLSLHDALPISGLLTAPPQPQLVHPALPVVPCRFTQEGQGFGTRHGYGDLRGGGGTPSSYEATRSD